MISKFSDFEIFHGFFIPNYAVRIVIFLNSFVVMYSISCHDNYYSPNLNSYIVYRSLLFISKVVGTVMKSPSFMLTYAVDVIVIF